MLIFPGKGVYLFGIDNFTELSHEFCQDRCKLGFIRQVSRFFPVNGQIEQLGRHSDEVNQLIVAIAQNVATGLLSPAP